MVDYLTKYRKIYYIMMVKFWLLYISFSSHLYIDFFTEILMFEK